jgi:hypothetical protein
LQVLILMNKLYVNKIAHNKVNSLGKQKEQNFQGFYIRILTLFYKNPIKSNEHLQA